MRECCLLFKTSSTYKQIYMLLLNPFRVGFGMEAFWLFILSPSGFLCIIANCPLFCLMSKVLCPPPLRSLPSSLRPLRETFLCLLSIAHCLLENLASKILRLSLCLLINSCQKVQDCHSYGHAIFYLAQNDRMVGIGHITTQFHAAVYRARMHYHDLFV